MALIPSTTYAGQIDVDSTHYPLGKARNISVAGANDGTPFEKMLVNDIWGFQQALLAAGGITASGNPDTADVSQYLSALQNLFAPNANRIMAAGGIIKTISFSNTGTDYTSSASSVTTFDFSSAKQYDLIQVNLLLIAYTAGVGAIRLSWMDSTESDTSTVVLDSVIDTSVNNSLHAVSITASHVVGSDGTVTMILRGIGNGVVPVHVKTPYSEASNHNLGSYIMIRP